MTSETDPTLFCSSGSKKKILVHVEVPISNKGPFIWSFKYFKPFAQWTPRDLEKGNNIVLV